MSGERYYTTKIWPQPSSTGSSNEDASFISTDPRGEPVTSTWKKSCREVETVPEFPELTCQNFRNPHRRLRFACGVRMKMSPDAVFLANFVSARGKHYCTEGHFWTGYNCLR